VTTNGCANPAYGGAGGPLAGLWDALGGNSSSSLAPLGQLLFNQFRPTGPNYAWSNTVSEGILSKLALDALLGDFSLPHAPGNVYVPYFNVKEFESSGSSIYHGMTVTLRKRYSRHFQLLGSYTWSHAIDDSTDLQTVQELQDNTNTRLDRGNSNFDQRHRFVVSGVFDTRQNTQSVGVLQRLLSNWTLAPVIELSSGRPYSLLTYRDSSLINSPDTARPDVVALGTSGSYISPDGKVGLIQPPLGSVGNLGRNTYQTGGYATVDFRLMRHIHLGERISTDLGMDVFNLFNRVNIREVDRSYTQGGRPVAAFNPRQIQFGVKVVF